MNNETQWTPGPWSVSIDCDGVQQIVNADFQIVANIDHEGAGNANMALILAAPEMAEVLAAMLKHAEGTNTAFYGIGKRSAMIEAFAGQKELMQTARALLAKIKGAQ